MVTAPDHAQDVRMLPSAADNLKARGLLCSLHRLSCKHGGQSVPKAIVAILNTNPWGVGHPVPSLQEVQRTLGSVLAQATVLDQQACLRPLSPDGSPVIGALTGTEGAFIATGAVLAPLLLDSCCSSASLTHPGCAAVLL